jgi:hypothetical protein
VDRVTIEQIGFLAILTIHAPDGGSVFEGSVRTPLPLLFYWNEILKAVDSFSTKTRKNA